MAATAAWTWSSRTSGSAVPVALDARAGGGCCAGGALLRAGLEAADVFAAGVRADGLRADEPDFFGCGIAISSKVDLPVTGR
jgi:hypothetical protein